MRKMKNKVKDDENYIPRAFRKNTKDIDNNGKNKKMKNEKNSKIHKKTKGKRKKEHHSKVKKFILITILLIILILGIYIGITTHIWKKLAKDMIINQNSIVQDVDGNILASIGSTKNKKNIKYEQIPENLKKAYISIEDERFYSHGGIDIKRTGGAIVSYVFHFGSSSYGGSTITQQLVKNLTGD